MRGSLSIISAPNTCTRESVRRSNRRAAERLRGAPEEVPHGKLDPVLLTVKIERSGCKSLDRQGLCLQTRQCAWSRSSSCQASNLAFFVTNYMTHDQLGGALAVVYYDRVQSGR